MRCTQLVRGLFVGGACVVVCGLVSRGTTAEEVSRSAAAKKGVVSTTANRPVRDVPAVIAEDHPLTAVIEFAEEEKAYLHRKVQSVSCRLTKRERIEGKLQRNQFLVMEMEEELRSGDEITRPMRVFLSFLGPGEVTGRKVLFVQGDNSGKMLVRKGGKRFNYAVVRIEPDGDSAMRESMVPITELGFGRLLDRQIAVLRAHIKIDPKGDNTDVEYYTDAKINGRRCEVIRIVHPVKQPGLTFHMANVYIDAELHVPVRIDASDWPTEPGGNRPILAEYTYTDLRLNVVFPEATFDPDRLKK